MPALAARRWASYLHEAFPDERVDLANLSADIDLTPLTDDPTISTSPPWPSPAALICSSPSTRASALSLRQHGAEVIAPDEFLSAAFDDEPVALLHVLRAQAAAWGGGRPVTELLDAVERARAPQFVAKVRARLAS